MSTINKKLDGWSLWQIGGVVATETRDPQFKSRRLFCIDNEEDRSEGAIFEKVEYKLFRRLREPGSGHLNVLNNSSVHS